MQDTTLSKDGQSLLTLAFIMWQNGKYTRALAILEGLRHLEPESEAYLPLLCAVYLDNGLYEETVHIGQMLLKKTTGEAHMCAAKLCAQALWKNQKHAEAQALMQQAMEKSYASSNS